MLLDVILAVYAAVLGLIVGSYLNVVIYRLPRGVSTVTPGSRCPACGAPIRARDNLPVVSYLLLGGRCRVCREPIPWRYPAIEAVTALFFVACLFRFGLGLEALAGALFCSLLVALAAIDVEHLLLPDRLTLPGTAVGLALQPWLSWAGLRAAAVGALLGAALLLAVYGAWYLLRGEEGMGLGDVKMLAMIGAFVGWKGVLVALFFGALSGSAAGLVVLWRSRRDASAGAAAADAETAGDDREEGRGQGLKAKLPFGAFLALGGLVALFAGERIAAAYLAQLVP